MRGDLDGLYRRNSRHVRNQLLALGVPRRDLDDLCHDVFLVPLRKLHELEVAPSIERLWLKQVGEFVVSNYRRRAFRYFERSTPPEELELTLADGEGASDTREQADLLQVLLRALPAAESDLLALRLVGELSFRTLSELCDADRKTLRKQFLRAVRRARLALRDSASCSVDVYPETLAATQVWHGTSVPHCPSSIGSNKSTFGCSEPALSLRAVDDCVAVGLLGPIAITHWYGKVTSASLEMVMRSIRGAMCGGRFGYFAMVDECAAPPGFEARRKLFGLLRSFRKEVVAHVTVTQASSFVQPIMSALAVLSRAPFPMRVVRTVPEAARWMLESVGNQCTPLPEARTLSRAAEDLRAIRMASTGGAPTAAP